MATIKIKDNVNMAELTKDFGETAMEYTKYGEGNTHIIINKETRVVDWQGFDRILESWTVGNLIELAHVGDIKPEFMFNKVIISDVKKQYSSTIKLQKTRLKMKDDVNILEFLNSVEHAVVEDDGPTYTLIDDYGQSIRVNKETREVLVSYPCGQLLTILSLFNVLDPCASTILNTNVLCEDIKNALDGVEYMLNGTIATVYVDSNISYEFDTASLFALGMTVVHNPSNTQSYGVINKKGSFIVAPQHDAAWLASEFIVITLLNGHIDAVNNLGEPLQIDEHDIDSIHSILYVIHYEDKLLFKAGSVACYMDEFQRKLLSSPDIEPDTIIKYMSIIRQYTKSNK